jgi:diguanylate cyclase (GGDEF)-like protein
VNSWKQQGERRFGINYIAAGFLAATFFAWLMFENVQHSGYDRISARALADAGQLVEITGGFVRTYSAYGALYTDKNTLPNPAIFRAAALEDAEKSERDGGTFTTGVLGLPGRQIRLTAEDEETRTQLLELASEPNKDVVSSVSSVDGKTSHRSLWAFYATDQACADCHNRLQSLTGEDQWKLGDLMGAQIVERDISSQFNSVRRNAIVQTVLLFVAVLAAWICCLYLINHFRLTRELKILATTDPLTGFLNRRAFNARIRNLQGSTNGALLMLDLDHFKRINDTYGHDVGDEVIKDFSQRIKQQIRDDDWAVRLGGEEFAVWLSDIKAINAIKIAERIRENVETAEITRSGELINYTTSIGVNIINNDKATSFESWLKKADNLLYRAKAQGRNRIICGETAEQTV